MEGCIDGWEIHINGEETAKDEFDVSVIAHEFGHYLVYSSSKSGDGARHHG